MAQDINEKIRAAAQAKNVDPEVALRIANVESGGKAAAKNPRSSAEGIFQIIDDTWRRYGGRPGKKLDADENIRVGTDILADNTAKLTKALGRSPQGHEVYTAHFFGPEKGKQILQADPATPLNSLLSKDVLKANPELRNQTVGQFLGNMQNKMGKSNRSAGAGMEAGPTPSEETMTKALGQNIAGMGTGYQAALALSFLSDEKGDKEDDEEDKDSGPSAAEQLAQYKPVNSLEGIDIGYSSPFAQPQAAQPQQVAQAEQPQVFAHGGVVHRADGSPEYGEIPTGGITEDTMTTFRRPVSAREMLEAAKSVGADIGRGAISNAESLVRGAVSQVPGVVGDLESLGRKALNFSFGAGGVKVDEKTYAPTSEEIRAAVPRVTAARPESAGMESLGEVMAPGLAKAATPAAKMVGKEAARQMLRGMEGEGPLASVSPPVMYAVKPRGGTFATSGSLDKPELSNFDELLDKYAGRAMQEVPEANQDLVRDFIDKKARKYFTTEFGTGDDSLRTAMRTGELPLSGKDVEKFPPYLLEAARNPEAVGHEMAKRHLEKFYDENANIDTKVLGLHNPSDADARRLFSEHMNKVREEQRQLMTAEGVPTEFQNTGISTYALPELEQYPSSTRVLRNLVEAGESGQLPSGVQGALQRQQPIYDIGQPYMDLLSPKQVAENIAAIPANKLKNMSFADAMIEGAKKMQVYRDYDTAIARADKGSTIPKTVLETFTKPFLTGNTGEWKQLTDARATELEGKLMNHSVGGYREGDRYGSEYTGLPYGGKKAFDEGLVKVYSLRDKKGMPTVTLEMAKSEGGKGNKWDITQIRGAFNSEPAANQWDDIFKFIEKGEGHIGQIKQNSYTRDRTGEVVPGSVVNWGSAYRDWKEGIDPTQGVTRSSNPPGWGNAELANGGLVERNYDDNRRYL